MPVAGLDVAQFITTVSATVTATAAVYTAARVRQTVKQVLQTVEKNEDRSRQNRRLLLGGEATEGVVERLQEVEEEADV